VFHQQNLHDAVFPSGFVASSALQSGKRARKTRRRGQALVIIALISIGIVEFVANDSCAAIVEILINKSETNRFHAG
jgi:hypothetical protein